MDDGAIWYAYEKPGRDADREAHGTEQCQAPLPKECARQEEAERKPNQELLVRLQARNAGRSLQRRVGGEDRYPPKGQSPTKTHASLAVPTAVSVTGTYFAPQAYGLNYPTAQAPRVKMKRDREYRFPALLYLSLPTGEKVSHGD